MQILRKEINASKYFIGYDKPYDKTHVVEFEGENYMDGFRVIFDEKSSDHDIVFYLKEFDVNSFYKMNYERKNK
jgi:hypothetical protein